MEIIIELDGKKHHLIKTKKKFKNPCEKCSLKSKCTGRHGKMQEATFNICLLTGCGFKEIKEGRKIGTLAEADKRLNQIAHDLSVLEQDMKNAGFVGSFMEIIDSIGIGFGYAALEMDKAIHPESYRETEDL